MSDQNCLNEKDEALIKKYLLKVDSNFQQAGSNQYLVIVTEGCQGCLDKIINLIKDDKSFLSRTTLVITPFNKNIKNEFVELFKGSKILYDQNSDIISYGISSNQYSVYIENSKDCTNYFEISLDKIDNHSQDLTKSMKLNH